MAEFVTVVKKLATMCNQHNSKCVCNGILCPLKPGRLREGGSCSMYIQEHPAIVENLIMTWEKSVDWSKVPVDTKVLVKDGYNTLWVKRYFAKYEDGRVYTFQNGATSFSTGSEDICSWECAKLYEDNKNE